MKKIIVILIILITQIQSSFSIDLDGEAYIIPEEVSLAESDLKPFYPGYNWKKELNKTIGDIYSVAASKVNSPDKLGYRFMKYLLTMNVDELEIYSNIQLPAVQKDQDLRTLLLQNVMGRVMSNQDLTMMLIFRQDDMLSMPMDKDMFDIEKIYTRQHANGVYDLIYEDYINEVIKSAMVGDSASNKPLDIIGADSSDLGVVFKISDLFSYREESPDNFTVALKTNKIAKLISNNIQNIAGDKLNTLSQNPMAMIAISKLKNINLVYNAVYSKEGHIYRVLSLQYLPVGELR